MDQTSPIWRKKMKAMEKMGPQAPEYTMMTTARYLHALDVLHEEQELELKRKTARVKAAEAEVRALKTELLFVTTGNRGSREGKLQAGAARDP